MSSDIQQYVQLHLKLYYSLFGFDTIFSCIILVIQTAFNFVITFPEENKLFLIMLITIFLSKFHCDTFKLNVITLVSNVSSYLFDNNKLFQHNLFVFLKLLCILGNSN